MPWEIWGVLGRARCRARKLLPLSLSTESIEKILREDEILSMSKLLRDSERPEFLHRERGRVRAAKSPGPRAARPACH